MPKSQAASLDFVALAQELNDAWETCRLTTPLSRGAGLATIDDAYAVQSAWSALREGRGERLLGRKIGLTSRAMQEQAGFDRPDFGRLWASRFFEASNGRVEIPCGTFLQPRLEGEIAFLLGRSLVGPGVTLEQVLEATDALAASFEVVDSRFVRQDFKVIDTIADNASYGAFTLGPWDTGSLATDLRAIEMTIEQNGTPVVTGTGVDSLGHPAHAVAWLANTLADYDVCLEAGDIVLSGSLGRAIPVHHGDTFVLRMTGQAPLTIVFT